PRNGRVVETHLRKLPAPDHGHVVEAENLSGKGSRCDDQAGHGGCARRFRGAIGRRSFAQTPALRHAQACSRHAFAQKNSRTAIAIRLNSLRNSRGGISRSGYFDFLPNTFGITWSPWRPS